ncbi:olfactory receptor 52H1-like [Erpetoichthys calabaricus]|uniref:olfactory receptor 52H1-like n=1 Tax=Erpetoichthys calabaricus TaxID=27687 RepID=UPI002234E41C|nr:olfactory receptor 52H1-like [Erpetoichthys calabaricus]
MNNVVGNSSDFILEGFFFPPSARAPLFVLTLFGYTVIVFVNVLVFLVITLHKKLHEPMYIMLCNMIVCDLIGSTALMPRLMSDFFVDVRIISFEACFIQAFCIHMYTNGAQMILAVMAFDRYVAICNPLRYSTIMTPRTLVKLCSFAWGGAFIMVVVHLSLTTRLQKCKTLVEHAYCFIGAVFVLACGDYSVNNIYGLCMYYFLTALSLSAIAFTYTKILITCFFKSQSNSKSKAIHTCATHLSVYILFETFLLFSVMALRFPNINPNTTKAIGTLMISVPPCLNPMIYGICTNEIRNIVLKCLKNKLPPISPSSFDCSR